MTCGSCFVLCPSLRPKQDCHLGGGFWSIRGIGVKNTCKSTYHLILMVDWSGSIHSRTRFIHLMFHPARSSSFLLFAPFSPKHHTFELPPSSTFHHTMLRTYVHRSGDAITVELAPSTSRRYAVLAVNSFNSTRTRGGAAVNRRWCCRK